MAKRTLATLLVLCLVMGLAGSALAGDITTFQAQVMPGMDVFDSPYTALAEDQVTFTVTSLYLEMLIYQSGKGIPLETGGLWRTCVIGMQGDYIIGTYGMDDDTLMILYDTSTGEIRIGVSNEHLTEEQIKKTKTDMGITNLKSVYGPVWTPRLMAILEEAFGQ